MALYIVTDAPLVRGPASYCEGGADRIKAKLEENGMKLGDTITMRDAIHLVGVSDAVFGLPYVIKQSQGEAGVVMLKYMAYLLDIAKTALPQLGVTKYTEEMRAVEKRTLGHNRPELLANANKLFNELLKGIFSPADMYAMTAMVHLSSNKTDNIAASHAGIALMDWGRASGRREQVAELLKHKLYQLIPSSLSDKFET